MITNKTANAITVAILTVINVTLVALIIYMVVILLTAPRISQCVEHGYAGQVVIEGDTYCYGEGLGESESLIVVRLDDVRD